MSSPTAACTLAAILFALLATGCTTLGSKSFVSSSSMAIAPLPPAAFTADGRISARHGQDAIAVTFRWKHEPPRDDIALSTPLGQIVAELEGDASAGFTRIALADGRTVEAKDWAALTERALGFPLPIPGLSSWVRGGPHADSPYEAEVDAAGRPATLRQDGWEIDYDYPDASAARPSRLRLKYPEVNVRVVLDHIE